MHKRILIQVMRGLLSVLALLTGAIRAAADMDDGDLAERVRQSGEW